MSKLRQSLLEEGYFVLRGVLSKDDIAGILDRLRWVCAHFDAYREVLPIWKAIPEALRKEDPLTHFDWLDGLSYIDPTLWNKVAAHPRLMEVACGVLGDRVFPTNGGGFFMKPSGSLQGVPWHQDVSPFREEPIGGACVNPLLFDFWLGITEATEEMGCLQ